MDVLHVCPLGFGEVGGVPEHVRNICIRLAKEHNVTVYVTDSRKHFSRYELIDEVMVKRFRSYAPSDSYFFSWDMLLALRKANFDIVHAHCYHAFPMHFSRLAQCKGFIVTTHFHGVGHSTFRKSLLSLLKPFGKRTLDIADKIVAVSEYEKELIYKQFKLDTKKVVVIPNGVDLKELSSFKRQNRDCKNILYIGNLFEYKGIRHLVEVLPKLAFDVNLEIVGSGPLRHFLEKRAKDLKVYNRVRFCQNLSRKELLQKYFDADLFVLLSRHEAYSLVVAEALTAGTPCIVANISASSEWVDNETCFGVKFPVDLRELAKQINEVLANGVDRQSMRKWIGTKILDWSDVVERLENIYARVLYSQ